MYYNYNFRYVDMVGITNPSDNINFVMRQLANDLNATISGNVTLFFIQPSKHVRKLNNDSTFYFLYFFIFLFFIQVEHQTIEEPMFISLKDSEEERWVMYY